MLFKISLARHICRGDEIRPLRKGARRKKGRGMREAGLCYWDVWLLCRWVLFCTTSYMAKLCAEFFFASFGLLYTKCVGRFCVCFILQYQKGKMSLEELKFERFCNIAISKTFDPVSCMFFLLGIFHHFNS